MRQFGVTDEDIAQRRFTREFRRMMHSLVDDSLKLLREGGRVAALVDADLAVTLRLFEAGGRAALDGIVRQDYDVLAKRPQVSKRDQGEAVDGGAGGQGLGSALPPKGKRRMTLGDGVCVLPGAWRGGRPRTFYWSFRVLPREKSDAMCAVYAFMRRADDLADDESDDGGGAAVCDGGVAGGVAGGSGERRRRGRCRVCGFERYAASGLGFRMGCWKTWCGGLRWTSKGARARRWIWAEGCRGIGRLRILYRYCYLVASVVGLVSIKVFGYTDPAAEKLAERTGIAFQLTNILRDVKEDAERKGSICRRICLEEFGVSNEDVLALAGGAGLRGRTNGR